MKAFRWILKFCDFEMPNMVQPKVSRSYVVAPVMLCTMVFVFHSKFYNFQSIFFNQDDSRKPFIEKISAVTGRVYSGKLIRESAITNFDFSFKTNHLHKKDCSLPLVGVTTTIQPHTRCIDEAAQILGILVVGDEGGATYRNTPNITFLSIADQKQLYPQFEREIPTRSFARKNLGLMHAFLGLNACAVWDFDDDNCMSDDTRRLLLSVISSGLQKPSLWLTSQLSVVNPYLLFGSTEYIWPRGLPLEHLAAREFPRIVKGDSKTDAAQTDVIQVMQGVDPDVDALWRLQHSKDLPMQWEMPRALAGHLVGIHPSRVAPFNAQATVLSRRALTVAFLPSTVHGRVSDIWRSYIMQYLLARAEAPGVLAFSGASVFHYRSKHNFMADLDAESQLYRQSMALVRYLESRPLSSCRAHEAFVRLMDDLYMRGFVEEGDVRAAAAWANLMMAGPAPVLLDLKKQAGISPPAPPPNTAVVAVLHINFCHREVVPLWMALHSHQFLAVQVYTPGCGRCDPISGVAVHCISADTRGYFAYESALHAMARAAEWPAASGFLFAHDDAVWQPGLRLGNDSRWIGPCQSPRGPLSCYDPVGLSVGWSWGNRAVGRPAAARFMALLRASKDPLGRGALEPHRGQADFFYVAARDAAAFARYGGLMREAGLFLEIAVPTLFVAALNATARPLAFFTLWGGRRGDPVAFGAELRASGAEAGHPVKLSSVDGIRGHLW